jgi:predicted MFS family arabinose efflux permease
LPSNIQLYPWFQFCRSLLFWQAIWFLYFQKELSAAEAILLAAVYDISTTALEVPSGIITDRLGRRSTLIAAIAIKVIGALLLAFGNTFAVFALAQICLGASMAFISGTDTSLLYETLVKEERGHEIQTHEQRAWRFTFAALAISAVTGGLLAIISPVWTFLASAAAACIALIIATRFEEPARSNQQSVRGYASTQFADITTAMRRPALTWLFCLTVGMYTFSHVPYVFGQPFILQAATTANLNIDASMISGIVSAAMMTVSVAASWIAPALQRTFGTGRILLLALSLQVGLIACLASTNHPLAIALLFLRMTPDALARPYIVARIHPHLPDTSRATYFSIQSLCGRLLFAATLFLSTLGASSGSELSYPEFQTILAWYAAGGLLMIGGLAIAITRVRLD